MSDLPFVADIRSQADGLRRVLDAGVTHHLEPLAGRRFDRIVMTGMGASLFALYPAWLDCLRAGLPAWWVEGGELLQEGQELITDRTLLFLTSQSGGSAELVALLEALAGRRPACVLAVSNDPESAVAKGADMVVPLLSGKEYTVSTRSYINSLAVTRIIAGMLAGRPTDTGPFVRAASALDPYLGVEWDGHVAAIREALGQPARLLILGRGDALGTAWQGALVIKEAAKVAAEGISTAQFRHGPYELAEPGTTLIILEGEPSTAERDRHLADDLARLGARVLWIGPNPPDSALALPTASAEGLARGVVDIVPLEIAAVILAEAGGFVPGEFRHSAQITKSL